MNKNATVVLLVALAAGCTTPQDPAAPPMDPTRKVSEQDCARAVDTAGAGNLLCREFTEAERRAVLEEEERQARARREARERAERERLERERAEQLAREEAARKARQAEEERLAAERRRLQEEADRKAREAREREEARLRAEQEAREAAERECRRLEQQASEGRDLLEYFVANYGKLDEFKPISGPISAFLAKPRKPRPCP